MKRNEVGRRAFVGALLAGAATACTRTGRDRGVDDATPVADRCVPTEPNIEGPFFEPDAPQRAVLAGAGTPGRPLRVTGRVLDRECRTLPNAVLEVWQADDSGAYDNDGFDLRGTLRTGDDAAYRLDTIIPGRYRDGGRFRPAHIHVKVHAGDRAPLTTQLYFEGDPYLDGDPYARPSLIMRVTEADGLARATFDFVL